MFLCYCEYCTVSALTSLALIFLDFPTFETISFHFQLLLYSRTLFALHCSSARFASAFFKPWTYFIALRYSCCWRYWIPRLHSSLQSAPALWRFDSSVTGVHVFTTRPTSLGNYISGGKSLSGSHIGAVWLLNLPWVFLTARTVTRTPPFLYIARYFSDTLTRTGT